MAKAWLINDQDGNPAGWMIFCPACNEAHQLDFRWSFNGNLDAPTFGPTAPGGNCSLLVSSNNPTWKSYDPTKEKSVCHSHITDGKIAYCDDCTHALAGQTVELPDRNNWHDE